MKNVSPGSIIGGSVGVVGFAVAAFLIVLMSIGLLATKVTSVDNPGPLRSIKSTGATVTVIFGQISNITTIGTASNMEVFGDVAQGAPGFLFRVTFITPRPDANYSVRIDQRYAVLSGTPYTDVRNKTPASFEVFYGITSGAVGNYNIFRFVIS